ncbi:CBS-domain-containing protein [Viridothelium virens]|uniref:CBS-domain-containing protein n=1 Tax=Viridothelium virens TaxID=1048519 RepID=A0A6A6HKU7_VIRVR|nr:CBS-domain-containing protein [Viridothelium virens]
MSEGETANGGKIDTSTAAAARPLHPVDVVANEGGIDLGHEAVAFVAPSSYLRPRGHSRPSTPAVHKPMMTALDREQLEGLVSTPSVVFSVCIFFFYFGQSHRYCNHRDWGRAVDVGAPYTVCFARRGGSTDAEASYLCCPAIRACRCCGRPSGPFLCFPLLIRVFIGEADLAATSVASQHAIRRFLKVRTSYDVLPLSFRLIVFDTALLVKKSLNILIHNGIVSAPLWDSKTSTFAGLLTTSDYMNVIQYYWQNPDALAAVDQFRLSSLREIERAIGVQPLETVSIHPLRPLYEACRKMLESRARRIPLLDEDDETNRSMVVSVVTQYRILKFIAVNVKETEMLRKSLRDLDLGTYTNLQTAKMESPVIDVIHMLVKYSISSIPILDSDGVVINVFEAVDVITLIKGGVYDDLNLNVGEALLKRSDDFPGIYTCTVNDRLDTIFDTIRKSRVHRLVVIDEYSRLKGLLTLSDILEYILLEGEDSEQPAD